MKGEGRRSWRSWFWNLFLAVCVGLLAGILTGVAIAQAKMPGRAGVAVGFGIAAFACWVGACRSLFMGVSADARGIVMRGFVRTVTIPWAEVVDISSGPLRSGAAGSAGASTPVVMRKRSEAQPVPVELNVLGGYGLTRRHPARAERAVDGLKQRLSEWRNEYKE